LVILTAANAYGTNTTTNYISVTAPLLKVASTATNTAVVSWPFPCADWQLQQNDDVGSTNWAPSPGPIQDDGSNNFVVVNVSSSALFYRLTLPAPVAEFTGTPTSGTSPLTVDFSDASLRKPASWAWTFGDGGTSTEQNPSHQYATDGTYTVSLTVSNAYGSGVQTKTNYITVNAPTSPVADFVGTPASGIRPLTVNFTDTSINSPTAWHWTFGDGGSSNDQNPSHQYTAIGNFTVALSVQNGAGSDSETKVNYITVTNSLPSPWLDQDIPSAAGGSATYNAGIFTVKGAGVDMYGTVDSFHFVYQVLATNRCTIVARVTSQQNTASYAKAGVVIRESLAGGARGSYMVLTPSDQSAFGWRTSLNGSTSDANGGYHSPPYWVKMVRNGNSFSAYQSSNGSTWTQVGSTQTIVMGSTSYVGLCVCGAANPTLATDTFDNVSVTVP
jgi:PKD repeat protein